MQITRAKAVALLNKGEMQLYDDSRHNPIRKFSVSQLESRITRARGVRDRARDLVRRQKLSSRQQTGSKRGTSGNANQRSKDKVEILADILKRFETRLGDAKKEAKASEKESAASPRARKTAVKKAAVKKTARKGTDGNGKRVTAKQALRSTHKVLAAKQEAARQPKPWQEVGSHGGQVSGEGFQSGSAARRAADLHAGEARLPAIHGSSATRDRISQGKRDSHDSGD